MGGGGDAFDFVGLGEKGKEGGKTGGGGVVFSLRTRKSNSTYRIR